MTNLLAAIPPTIRPSVMNQTERACIEKVATLSVDELNACDFTLDIAHELNAPYQDLLDCRPVPLRRKDYGFDPAGWAQEATSRNALFQATTRGRLAGFVAISESWNGMAEIAEIAVDRAHRGRGIGQLLLSAAATWASRERFDFMRLETQADNVPACRAYARAGFVLGGHDRFLYAGGENDGEVALFWYKDLRNAAAGQA